NIPEQYRLNQRDFDVWNRNQDTVFGNTTLGQTPSFLSHTQDVGSHSATSPAGGPKSDILLLVESAECFNKSYHDVLQFLPRQLLVTAHRRNMHLQMGIMRYSSATSTHSLVYYTHRSPQLLGEPYNLMGTLADNLKRGSISLGSGHTPTVEEDLSHTNEVE
ncbi:hypothetical protein FHG87_025454, partial [Trinorchestia longiramus]